MERLKKTVPDFEFRSVDDAINILTNKRVHNQPTPIIAFVLDVSLYRHSDVDCYPPGAVHRRLADSWGVPRPLLLPRRPSSCRQGAGWPSVQVTAASLPPLAFIVFRTLTLPPRSRLLCERFQVA